LLLLIIISALFLLLRQIQPNFFIPGRDPVYLWRRNILVSNTYPYSTFHVVFHNRNDLGYLSKGINESYGIFSAFSEVQKRVLYRFNTTYVPHSYSPIEQEEFEREFFNITSYRQDYDYFDSSSAAIFIKSLDYQKKELKFNIQVRRDYSTSSISQENSFPYINLVASSFIKNISDNKVILKPGNKFFN
jgi:hypothetical protein